MPVGAALLGQAAREVQLGRLGRRVGGRVLAGHERVLGGDEHDRAAAALRRAGPGTPRARRGSSRCRGSRGCAPTRPASSPRSARSTRRRRSRRRCRRRRTPSTAASNASRTASSRGDVAGDGRAAVAESATASARPRRRGRTPTTQAPRRRERVDDRAADAAGRAGDERDLALQLAGRRRQRQLVELERPVLDREALALVERHEAAERVRARPSPRSRGGRGRATAAAFLVVVADADQPDVLDQHDARVGVGGLGLSSPWRST